MIIILYTVAGFYLFKASEDPAQHKALISFIIYGMGFGHCSIALLAVFGGFPPMGYFGPSVFGDIPVTVGGLNNWDKLCVAVPTWFTIGAGNLFFAKKDLGSYLLPWDIVSSAGSSPPSAQKVWLKIIGTVMMSIVAVAYGFKFGATWHDAGAPFVLSDIKFHPYYNMIIILYTVAGFYLLMASQDPAQCKSLISYAIYGLGFAHCTIALLAIFGGFPPMGYWGPSVFGDIPVTLWGLNNWDKLFVAVPTWFTIGAGNLFFAKKDLGSYLLPWAKVASAKETDDFSYSGLPGAK